MVEPGTENSGAEANAGALAVDPAAVERVYEELRAIAHRCVRSERSPGVWDTTSLVHEVWSELAIQGGWQWDNRRYFFGAASRAMRRVLVQAARRRTTFDRIVRELFPRFPSVDDRSTDVLELDAAMTRLESDEPHLSEIVYLAFYAGRPLHEVAELTGLSEPKARRDWLKARAALQLYIADARRS